MKFNVGDICLDEQDREWIIIKKEWHQGDYFLAEYKDSDYYFKKYFIMWGDRLKEFDPPYKKDNQYNDAGNPLDLTIFGIAGAALSAICYFLGF